MDAYNYQEDEVISFHCKWSIAPNLTFQTQITVKFSKIIYVAFF